MNKKDLEVIAKTLKEQAKEQYMQEPIFMDEICRLTGLRKSSIYTYRNSMPLKKMGNKVYSTREAIMQWNATR